MYLTRKRLIKKRCLYEFTLRTVHQFYRDKYNAILRLMKYEEKSMPGLVDIEDNHNMLIREYAAKNRCTLSNLKGIVIKS